MCYVVDDSDSSDDFLDEYGNVRIFSDSSHDDDADEDSEDIEEDNRHPQAKKGKKNKKKKTKTQANRETAPPARVQPEQNQAPVWDFSQPRESILTKKEQVIIRDLMMEFQTAETKNMLEKKNEFDFLQQVRFRRSFVFS
jgi:hypothetical protein